jgi:hypothetical protein
MLVAGPPGMDPDAVVNMNHSSIARFRISAAGIVSAHHPDTSVENWQQRCLPWSVTEANAFPLRASSADDFDAARACREKAPVGCRPTRERESGTTAVGGRIAKGRPIPIRTLNRERVEEKLWIGDVGLH